ncbi:MAG: DNA polymerase/3'-5' exonuclease PolX [Syntrophorhabdales bacterium]|jgi:DNA polymerase (family 10)
MPIHNSDIADIFNKLADTLEIEGANEFRVRAYRNAARVVNDLPQAISAMIDRGESLLALPGIGKDLEGKIKEIIETGTLSQLTEEEKRLPPGLRALMKIGGLGPKRVRALYEQLGIATISELKEAALGGRIRALRGFGKKTEEMVLEELREEGEERGKRVKLRMAEQIADSLTEYLKAVDGVTQVTAAGSYRRRKETVGDLDVLVTCSADCPVIDRFVSYGDVLKVISKGSTRSTVVFRSGIQVDLRVVPPESYGAALHYFTGSKSHNIAVRVMGVRRGLKINEYGVFRGEEQIAGRTEEEVYAAVGLPYIEPELRENLGEIEAARDGRLPQLITLKELRGDLHTHTSETDGRHTMREMAEAARIAGYEYLAVTDHSKRLAMTRGFDETRLARRNKEIDRLNAELKGIILLKSIEVDILEDGTLDLADSILKELDLTVCSVHSRFTLSREKQTERIIRAMDNPYFSILAHPSGRLIDERAPYDVDMERVIDAARIRGCILELNAQPDRLDLTDIYCKMAKESGVRIAVSTDAHSKNELALMRFGIAQARRGWLEPGDVVNTLTWPELKKVLKRR